MRLEYWEICLCLIVIMLFYFVERIVELMAAGRHRHYPPADMRYLCQRLILFFLGCFDFLFFCFKGGLVELGSREGKGQGLNLCISITVVKIATAGVVWAISLAHCLMPALLLLLIFSILISQWYFRLGSSPVYWLNKLIWIQNWSSDVYEKHRCKQN